jgi:hypothetical protein
VWGRRLKAKVRFGANGRGIGLLQRQKGQQNSHAIHPSVANLPLSTTFCHALAIEVAPVYPTLPPICNSSDSNKWANVQTSDGIVPYRKKD